MTLFTAAPPLESTHGYGHVDAQVAVVCKQLSYGSVEHQTVAVHDRAAHTFVNTARCGFPGQPPPVSIQL